MPIYRATVSMEKLQRIADRAALKISFDKKSSEFNAEFMSIAPESGIYNTQHSREVQGSLPILKPGNSDPATVEQLTRLWKYRHHADAAMRASDPDFDDLERQNKTQTTGYNANYIDGEKHHAQGIRPTDLSSFDYLCQRFVFNHPETTLHFFPLLDPTPPANERDKMNDWLYLPGSKTELGKSLGYFLGDFDTEHYSVKVTAKDPELNGKNFTQRRETLATLGSTLHEYQLTIAERRSSGQEKTVQVHFIRTMDKQSIALGKPGVPLPDFVRLYEAYLTQPTFIHCYAGMGRSGHLSFTFMVLQQYADIFCHTDNETEAAEKLQAVLKQGRSKRSSFVAASVQYRDAIRNAHQTRHYILANINNIKPSIQRLNEQPDQLNRLLAALKNDPAVYQHYIRAIFEYGNANLLAKLPISDWRQFFKRTHHNNLKPSIQRLNEQPDQLNCLLTALKDDPTVYQHYIRAIFEYGNANLLAKLPIEDFGDWRQFFNRIHREPELLPQIHVAMQASSTLYRQYRERMFRSANPLLLSMLPDGILSAEAETAAEGTSQAKVTETENEKLLRESVAKNPARLVDFYLATLGKDNDHQKIVTLLKLKKRGANSEQQLLRHLHEKILPTGTADEGSSSSADSDFSLAQLLQDNPTLVSGLHQRMTSLLKTASPALQGKLERLRQTLNKLTADAIGTMPDYFEASRPWGLTGGLALLRRLTPFSKPAYKNISAATRETLLNMVFEARKVAFLKAPSDPELVKSLRMVLDESVTITLRSLANYESTKNANVREVPEKQIYTEARDAAAVHLGGDLGLLSSFVLAILNFFGFLDKHQVLSKQQRSDLEKPFETPRIENSVQAILEVDEEKNSVQAILEVDEEKSANSEQQLLQHLHQQIRLADTPDEGPSSSADSDFLVKLLRNNPTVVSRLHQRISRSFKAASPDLHGKLERLRQTLNKLTADAIEETIPNYFAGNLTGGLALLRRLMPFQKPSYKNMSVDTKEALLNMVFAAREAELQKDRHSYKPIESFKMIFNESVTITLSTLNRWEPLKDGNIFDNHQVQIYNAARDAAKVHVAIPSGLLHRFALAIANFFGFLSKHQRLKVLNKQKCEDLKKFLPADAAQATEPTSTTAQTTPLTLEATGATQATEVAAQTPEATSDAKRGAVETDPTGITETTEPTSTTAQTIQALKTAGTTQATAVTAQTPEAKREAVKTDPADVTQEATEATLATAPIAPALETAAAVSSGDDSEIEVVEDGNPGRPLNC